MNRSPWVWNILIVLCGMLTAPAVAAHARLEHAEPRVGSSVQTAPAEVVLTFSEKLEPVFSTAQVLDANGKEVDVGKATVDDKAPNVLRIAVGKLDAGTYTVKWAVTSVDSHKTHGDFTFQVSP